MLAALLLLSLLQGCATFKALPSSLARPSYLLSSVVDDVKVVDDVPGRGVSGADVPTKGIIDYIGSTKSANADQPRWGTHEIQFKKATAGQLSQTRFNLWRQLPWKKFEGKAVLKIRLGGDLSIESAPSGGLPFSGKKDLEPVSSLADLSTLLLYGAYDPRVKGVFVELGPLACGYAKLKEARRMLEFFKQSGKEIIGYSESASEKELYLSLGFSEFYIPPDGSLDLRGFSASATFIRGVFDKIGIEPQVQRIGKYKSFGDTFNRTTIAEAQREVISSLLTEASDFWVDSVARDANRTAQQIRALWAEAKVQSPRDYQAKGLITGVKYFDQVEEIVTRRFSEARRPNFLQKLVQAFSRVSPNATEEDQKYADIVADFDVETEFVRFPRRDSRVTDPKDPKDPKEEKKKERARAVVVPKLVTGGGYLKRMRNGARILSGLPLKETRKGPRIAIINAVGGISSGESGSGLNGKTLGSATLIGLLRGARADPSIKAVVLRVDSPGGSALASDVMWRELRRLAREKPVVASQVDVAASGGYYLSMGCDEIVAEELTVTGSIGVVASKFNLQKLNEKLGLASETISIGRYAEVFSTSRGFTEEEASFFEQNAQTFYKSFITKAARSRSMEVDAMHEVAQGRVWTGRQGLQRGLVDHMGGLWKALEVAAQLSGLHVDRKGNPIENPTYMVQTFKEPSKGLSLPFGLGARAAAPQMDTLAMCDDVVATTGLVAPESLGLSPGMPAGVTPMLQAMLRSSGLLAAAEEQIAATNQRGFLTFLQDLLMF
ncbi:peptidase family S49-domain-containing protein [Ochromonadaceae sp. CCMP2298]|nr:peptidase family S49-domain-containing protein [Ochromonadaceae sp. CCMP2298]|mmetsp:Transcript_7148/g.15554  ORF Transcript_7148/g.15554 Transcript_7148/m.15554 type:complete len:779 (-) Transcript_7148:105-2441(-)